MIDLYTVHQIDLDIAKQHLAECDEDLQEAARAWLKAKEKVEELEKMLEERPQ